MLEKLSDVPRDVVAVRAVGKLTREDYENVVECSHRLGGRLSCLLRRGPPGCHGSATVREEERA